MAVAFVSGSGSSTIVSDAITISFTVAAGDDRLLMGFAGWRDVQVPTAMTFDGNALTGTVTQAGAGAGNNKRSVELRRLIAPDVKTADFVCTYTAAAEQPMAGVANFTGTNQTTPLGTAATDQGLQSELSNTVSPGSDDTDLVVNAFCNTTAVTHGASQDERIAVDSTSNLYVTTKAGATTSTDMQEDFLTSTIDFAHIAVAIKPAAAVGGDAEPRLIGGKLLRGGLLFRGMVG